MISSKAELQLGHVSSHTVNEMSCESGTCSALKHRDSDCSPWSEPGVKEPKEQARVFTAISGARRRLSISTFYAVHKPTPDLKSQVTVGMILQHK
jgi:hypothetical protein